MRPSSRTYGGPSPRSTPSLALALAFGAGAAALLAGCSSGHPSAGPTTTASSTTTSAAAPTVPTTTTSVPGASAHCGAARVVVSVIGSQGAAGTIETSFQIHNTSTAPCTLQGYPGAQLYDAAGATLPTTVVPGGSYSFTNFTPSAVALAPGASAYFNMGYSDVPTGSSGACPTAATIAITPPGAVDHATVTQQIMACNGRLTVSPVFGADSQQTLTTAPHQG